MPKFDKGDENLRGEWGSNPNFDPNPAINLVSCTFGKYSPETGRARALASQEMSGELKHLIEYQQEAARRRGNYTDMKSPVLEALRCVEELLPALEQGARDLRERKFEDRFKKD